MLLTESKKEKIKVSRLNKQDIAINLSNTMINN